MSPPLSSVDTEFKSAQAMDVFRCCSSVLKKALLLTVDNAKKAKLYKINSDLYRF